MNVHWEPRAPPPPKKPPLRQVTPDTGKLRFVPSIPFFGKYECVRTPHPAQRRLIHSPGWRLCAAAKLHKGFAKNVHGAKCEAQSDPRTADLWNLLLLQFFQITFAGMIFPTFATTKQNGKFVIPLPHQEEKFLNSQLLALIRQLRRERVDTQTFSC